LEKWYLENQLIPTNAADMWAKSNLLLAVFFPPLSNVDAEHKPPTSQCQPALYHPHSKTSFLLLFEN
jgi:hypothetical protein